MINQDAKGVLSKDDFIVQGDFLIIDVVWLIIQCRVHWLESSNNFHFLFSIKSVNIFYIYFNIPRSKDFVLGIIKMYTYFFMGIEHDFKL